MTAPAVSEHWSQTWALGAWFQSVVLGQWGASCGLRGLICVETCPTGLAWYAKGSTATLHAMELECSGAGLCDFTTGDCVCSEGYTGDACEKSECAYHVLYCGLAKRVQNGPFGHSSLTDHSSKLLCGNTAVACANSCNSNGLCMSMASIVKKHFPGPYDAATGQFYPGYGGVYCE